MGEGSDQIKQHIDATRDALGDNLDELTDRVRPARIYRNHPAAVIGAGAVGALLVGWLVFSAVRGPKE